MKKDPHLGKILSEAHFSGRVKSRGEYRHHGLGELSIGTAHRQGIGSTRKVQIRLPEPRLLQIRGRVAQSYRLAFPCARASHQRHAQQGINGADKQKAD